MEIIANMNNKRKLSGQSAKSVKKLHSKAKNDLDSNFESYELLNKVNSDNSDFNDKVEGLSNPPMALFPIIPSDEPLDMTLSSRKRARSPSPVPPEIPIREENINSDKNELQDLVVKKIRLNPSLKSATTAKVRSRRKPLRSLIPNAKSKSTIIVTPEYSDEGINNHFRRSLSKYAALLKDMATAEQVDLHFIRSLGWDVWWSTRPQTVIPPTSAEVVSATSSTTTSFPVNHQHSRKRKLI